MEHAKELGYYSPGVVKSVEDVLGEGKPGDPIPGRKKPNPTMPDPLADIHKDYDYE